MDLTLPWCHNGRGSVSNHQPHDCLLNRLFTRRSKKTTKLRVTGLWVGTSPGTAELPSQIASSAFPFDDVIMIVVNVVQYLCRQSTDFLKGLSTCDKISFLTWPAVNMDMSKIEIKRARYCDVLSNRGRRHQQNVNRACETRVDLREVSFYLHVWVYYVF